MGERLTDAGAVTESVRPVTGLFSPRRRVAVVALFVVLCAGWTWLLVWLITAPPASFRNRAELPSCGRMAGGPGPITGQGVDCFDAALHGGRPAELVVVTTTSEGDPIVTYYRA